MDFILKYFPELTERQREQFAALLPLYEEWNAQINVISRKDMENFYEHHVLHSLAIAKAIRFAPMTEVLDVGTGGGFPGVPLAVMFPEARFTLVDSIGKKIKVVNDVVERLGLKNTKAMQTRAEQLDGEYDFVVSRAVTTLGEFVPWVKKKVTARELVPLPWDVDGRPEPGTKVDKAEALARFKRLAARRGNDNDNDNDNENDEKL